MAAKDIFHDAVRKGLEKEGWIITDDPLRIRAGRVDMQIDLGAEKLIAAERGEEKIAVEIKSFTSPSNISEFHTALGQFLNYRVALEEQQPDRFLYLAVPQGTYKTFFNLPFVETIIERFQLSILVYEPNKEAILEWKK
ncbi:XisH family protein [Nostoc sp. FACHB-280]|uniref:XisH family protein n=1 Tax=Nostoc sp. FACHB-280 TaxID=2692839 RepID=UPI00168B408E|nr:XisH family protein [Nostoc sp. FACHB-280]MBD2494338.1 XisH family protein [Nostoc sp. FACHB-280]